MLGLIESALHLESSWWIVVGIVEWKVPYTWLIVVGIVDKKVPYTWLIVVGVEVPCTDLMGRLSPGVLQTTAQRK